MKKNKNNTLKEKSLGKGYCWDKNRNKWMVRFSSNRKQYFIGRYETEEEARLAYKIARLIHSVIF
jgi:hypothetical protein